MADEPPASGVTIQLRQLGRFGAPKELCVLIDKFVGVCGENQELSKAIKTSKAAAASRQAFLSNVVGVLILAVLVQRFYYAWRV